MYLQLSRWLKRGGWLSALLCVGLCPFAGLAAPNPLQDHRTCSATSGEAGIAACTRAIDSGKFVGRGLGILFNHRGWKYYEAGAFDQAIAEFTIAILYSPHLAVAFANRAIVLAAKGDFEGARNDYLAVLRIDPQDGGDWNSRCWAWIVIGDDLDQAIFDCTEAIRQNRNYASAIERRGLAYLRLGRLYDAIADYNAALKLEPSNFRSLYGRGIARLRSGDVTGGKADIRAATAIRKDIAEEFARLDLRPEGP
jgi:tetratricopeptide (TPR) repeat protein